MVCGVRDTEGHVGFAIWNWDPGKVSQGMFSLLVPRETRAISHA